MLDLLPRLKQRLPEEAVSWLDAALQRVAAEGADAVPELFPRLPRRLRREPLGGGRVEDEGAVADLDAWRLCDAGALTFLQRAGIGEEALVDLFQHGDLEERTMVLRCLHLLPVTAATVRLLGEAQRTNTVSHFEAAVCDGNLAVRALQHPGFGQQDLDRLILKLAFLDIRLARVLGAEEHADEELSRMLQGLATEREAAGRAVWPETCRLIARAPIAGTVARLVGHLEHGDDGHRLAAAEGIACLNRPDLAPFVRERLEREPRAEIRAALERALADA